MSDTLPEREDVQRRHEQIGGEYRCSACRREFKTIPEFDQHECVKNSRMIGEWCDDCHSYVHAPWCPHYSESSKEVIDRTMTTTHQPAARDGGDGNEWEYTETRYGAEAKAGNFIIRLHWTGLADIGDTRGTIQQIVTEHNQHQSLVAERERLRVALRRLSITGRGALPVDEYRDWVKEVADEALGDQKGGPQ